MSELFPNTGFPELRVSANTAARSSCNGSRSQPGSIANGGLCGELNPARLFFSRSLASFLLVKLLLRDMDCWSHLFSRQ